MERSNRKCKSDRNNLSITKMSDIIQGGLIRTGGNTFGVAARIGTNDAFSLELETNNTLAVTIDSSQNVGIGVTPSSKIHVGGAARFGVASTTAGSLILQNATNANTLTIQSGVTSGTYTITLPTAQGAASTFLMNDGAGVLSWATAAAAGAWSLTGNATGNDTSFIGTTDNQTWLFKSNNTTYGTLSKTGLWSFGTVAPVASTRVTITGSGTTDATIALAVYNSTPAILFSVHDAGRIQAGFASNLFIGVNSGEDLTSGINNVAFGDGLANLTSGSGNTSIGISTGSLISTGNGNTGVGNLALQTLSTAIDNTAVGYGALQLSNASHNTAFGFEALESCKAP